MPDKVTPKKPIKKPVFSDLSPTQVRITDFYEIGEKYQGSLGDLVSTSCDSCQKCHGCESCQKCECCESCQKSSNIFELEKEINFNNLKGNAIRFSREVTYELAQDIATEKGSSSLKQTQVVVEMPPEAFEKLNNKEKYVEVGSSTAGLKQYKIKN